MKHWPTKPLGEVSQISAGEPAPQRSEDFSADGIPFVRMQDVGRSGKTTNLTETKDRLSVVASRKFKRFPVGSILVPKSGASIRLNHRAILGVEAHVVSHLAVIIPNASLNTRFAYYWLYGMDLSSVAHDADLPSMKTSELAKLQIPVPPLSEQERIVTLLDEADALRKLRTDADRRTVTLIPALFDSMFGDTLVNDKGWRMSELENLTSNITDGKHGDCRASANSGYYFVSVKDIVDGRIDYSKAREILYEDFVEVHKRTQLEEGDVLITNSGTIGRTAVITPDEKVARTTFQKSVAIIKPIKDCIHPIYLRVALDTCVKQLTMASSGSAQKNLLLGQLRRFKICVPPMELQKEFAERVTEFGGFSAAQAVSRRRLDDVFKSTLYGAFTGKN